MNSDGTNRAAPSAKRRSIWPAVSLALSSLLLAITPVSASTGVGTVPRERLPHNASPPASGGTIRFGETVTGTVSSASGDRWVFSGRAGDVVTIALNGNSLSDPYVTLIGPDGRELASDDDSGPGYNALISNYALPRDGQYTIVARGCCASTGSYTLSLQRTTSETSPATLFNPPIAVEIPSDPRIAQVSHVACAATDTFLVLSLSGEGKPNYNYYEALVQAYGDARIAQVIPLVDQDSAARISRNLMIEMANLVLPGVGTVVDLVEAFAEEWERLSHTEVRYFRVVLYGTASQPPERFLVWATHSPAGGLTISTKWSRFARETISQSGTVPVCP